MPVINDGHDAPFAIWVIDTLIFPHNIDRMASGKRRNCCVFVHLCNSVICQSRKKARNNMEWLRRSQCRMMI